MFICRNTCLYAETHYVAGSWKRALSKTRCCPTRLPFQYQREPSYMLTLPHRKKKTCKATCSCLFLPRSRAWRVCALATPKPEPPNSHDDCNFLLSLCRLFFHTGRSGSQSSGGWGRRGAPRSFPLLWIIRNIQHLVIMSVMTHFWRLGFGLRTPWLCCKRWSWTGPCLPCCLPLHLSETFPAAL